MSQDTDQRLTATQQDIINRLNQSPAIHPDHRALDLMLTGAVQRGGELILDNDRLKARVAELEAILSRSCAEDRNDPEQGGCAAYHELEARVVELEAWIVDEVDPMSLGEPRRSEWYALHEKLHPENYK